MTHDPPRPLVTLYVMAYNQERFVREAVESALAQTYSPTEILLSDDCSTDGTFRVMTEIVSGYAGPHRIILNRNAANLGVSAHVNTIARLAHGELLVAADGDDVSRPERTARLVEAWISEGRPAALVSSVTCVDANGHALRSRSGEAWTAQFLPHEHESTVASLMRFAAEGSPRLISCSCAWTRTMHDAFGPMPPGIWFEDDLLTLRAWLYDRIVYLPDALVSYREHQSNIMNRVQPPLTTVANRRTAEQATNIHARRRRESLLAYLPDIDLARRHGWISAATHDELRRRIERRCAFYRVVEDWWTVNWAARVAQVPFMVAHGELGYGRWGTSRLLPYSVFLALGALWARIKRRRVPRQAADTHAVSADARTE